MASQNPLNCTKTAAQRLIFHNNIRKVGSFRNRQVTSSTLVVGSSFPTLTPALTVPRFTVTWIGPDRWLRESIRGPRLPNPAAVPAANLIPSKGMKSVANLLDEYSTYSTCR